MIPRHTSCFQTRQKMSEKFPHHMKFDDPECQKKHDETETKPRYEKLTHTTAENDKWYVPKRC